MIVGQRHMSNTPIPRKSDEQFSKDIAQSWVVADMREKIMAMKKAAAPPVDPNEPRGEFLGLCRSLVFGGKGKMSDTTITVGDDVFDVSDLQLEYRLDRTMEPITQMEIAEDFRDVYMNRKREFGKNLDKIMDKLIAEKQKRTFTNPETGKKYEAENVYQIPVRDRLTSKVYRNKLANKKKKLARKKNQTRNKR